MTDVQDYPSRFDDPESRRFGTLSYLPKMDAKRIREQVAYIIAQGWTPAVEHVEPDRAGVGYWYMWKLPMFGETDIDTVLREAASCHKSNPDNHVRLIGYDAMKQTQGASLVVYRGAGYRSG